MAKKHNVSTNRQTRNRTFKVTKVKYTDPETGKLYTLETKIGWIKAPDGYFIGKEPFDSRAEAYHYARTYGQGHARVMRQIIGNGRYYCYMHFFRFDEAIAYHKYLNVVKWDQKQRAKQRNNDKMLGLQFLDDLTNDPITKDTTASEGIRKAANAELKTRLKARKHNLDKYDRLQEAGYNAREISKKCGTNEWTVRDDLKRILDVKKKYHEEI